MSRFNQARPELRAAVIAQFRLGHGPGAIARILGITKNQACGYLYRAGLCTRVFKKHRTSMAERLDALHARMDRVLAECASQPGHRYKWTRELELMEREASGD